MKKNRKKVIYLVILILIAPVVWFFSTRKDAGTAAAQAKSELDLKTGDLAKIEQILNNIISLDLTAVHRTAPDQNDPPPYPRQTIRDPFQFGALPSSVATAKKKTASGPKPVSKTTAHQPRTEINPQNLRISGIVYDRRNPAVIIEGEIFHTGDSLKSLKIEKISRDGLILSGQGKQYNLKVPEDE